MINKAEIEPRMLMGPGPSDVHPRVLEAMAIPTLGYLDSQFFEILDDIRQMLKAVAVPKGVDDAEIRKRLLNEYGISLGGGLGEFKGKAWRIGLMGQSATQRHVDALLSALKTILADD